MSQTQTEPSTTEPALAHTSTQLQSTSEHTTTLSTLAEQLLKLITQQPNVDITSPSDGNKTVSLDELNNQIQTIAASEVPLQFDDFTHVVNTFSEQLNQHQQNTELTDKHEDSQNEIFHLDMNTFFSFTMLHKIGVLSDSLHHSEACAHIEPKLDSLNQALVFTPIAAPSNKPPRRRASLHRANLQLNKKRNSTQTNNPAINCLEQCINDLHQWEHDLLAHFMEACGELLHFTPVDFNRAIERLVTIHHHWRLFTNAWVRSQLQVHYL